MIISGLSVPWLPSSISHSVLRYSDSNQTPPQTGERLVFVFYLKYSIMSSPVLGVEEEFRLFTIEMSANVTLKLQNEVWWDKIFTVKLSINQVCFNTHPNFHIWYAK